MRLVLSATLTATLALSVATVASNPVGAIPVVDAPVTTTSVTALSQTLDDMTVDPQPLGASVVDLTTTDAPVDARAILGEIDGTLYVTDVAEHGGSELKAIVDGAVTPMVDVNPESSSYPVELIELAGRHYFIGVDDGNGRRLMQLDGTDISVVPGTGIVSTQVYEGDDFILLIADNGTDGFEPITFDGNTLEPLGDLNPGSGFSSVYWAEPGGAGLIVYLWSNGYRLFNIGHGSATEILHNGETIDSIGSMISDGTNAYFDLDLPATGQELYLTDGATVANSAVVPLSADGHLCVKAEGATHVLIDVAGHL